MTLRVGFVGLGTMGMPMTSLFGGRGSAWAALLGWLVIGSIYNGMYLLNLETDVQFMIIGAVLIGAVIIDALTRRGRQARTAG